MSRGKNLSLEEARKAGRLDQFAKEHPSEAERERFERLLEAMAAFEKIKEGPWRQEDKEGQG
jgi:hypothetical protein